MVEQQPSKLNTRVRFPSPAPRFQRFSVGRRAEIGGLRGLTKATSDPRVAIAAAAFEAPAVTTSMHETRLMPSPEEEQRIDYRSKARAHAQAARAIPPQPTPSPPINDPHCPRQRRRRARACHGALGHAVAAAVRRNEIVFFFADGYGSKSNISYGFVLTWISPSAIISVASLRRISTGRGSYRSLAGPTGACPLSWADHVDPELRRPSVAPDNAGSRPVLQDRGHGRHHGRGPEDRGRVDGDVSQPKSRRRRRNQGLTGLHCGSRPRPSRNARCRSISSGNCMRF